MKGTYHGKPCIQGHGTLRYKAGSACVVCSKNKSQERWRRPDDAWKKQRLDKYATEGGREDRRNRNLMENYGLTIAAYEAMKESQNDACAICGGPPRGRYNHFHVDHDHATGKVRALLCNTCNVGLGSMQDDPALLRIAADYLEKHRG